MIIVRIYLEGISRELIVFRSICALNYFIASCTSTSIPRETLRRVSHVVGEEARHLRRRPSAPAPPGLSAPPPSWPRTSRPSPCCALPRLPRRRRRSPTPSAAAIGSSPSRSFRSSAILAAHLAAFALLRLRTWVATLRSALPAPDLICSDYVQISEIRNNSLLF